MASRKGEKPQVGPSGVLPGGDGVKTPGSGLSEKDILQQQEAKATTVFYMPILLPATHRSLIFEGPNVSEFLEWYKDLCTDYWVSDEDKLARLPRYCI